MKPYLEAKVCQMIEIMIDSREEALPIEEVLDQEEYHNLCDQIIRLEESYKKRTGNWYIPFTKEINQRTMG